MIVFKFMICLSIVAICTLLGFDKSKSYDKRVLELQKIRSGFGFFKSKIEFTYEPIREIFEGVSNSVYSNNENIFDRTKIYINDLEVSLAWNKAISEETKIANEDKEILKQFGKLLGKTDKNGQISEIDLSLNFVENQIKKAEAEKKKYSKLYKSLGTLVGLGIIIILW